MLPRKNRVRTPAEFSETLRSGARTGRRNVVVSAHLTDEGLKAGFIVSKAVGNAVTRNRVKRRLRSAVAEVFAGPLKGHSGAQLVIRALPSSGEADWATLHAEVTSGIRSALKKAEGAGATSSATGGCR